MVKLLNISSWVLPSTVFTIELGFVILFGVQFDWISQPFFIISFILFFVIGKSKLLIYEFLFFFYVFFHGILMLMIFNLSVSGFLREFIPIFIVFVANISILRRLDIRIIFSRYVFFSYLVAFFGLIQIFLKFFFKIKLLTAFDDIWVDSVAFEPSHYVLIVLPALVYLFEYKKFNFRFFVILASIILTFKLTAVASIAIYLGLTNISKLRNAFLVIPTVAVLTIFILFGVDDFLDRFINISLYFQSGDLNEIKNLTSFSFASNFEIAKQNFLNTYGFGIGLGGHETIYKEFFLTNNILMYEDGINAASAHSLSIRVFSELGFVGIFLLIYFFYKIINLPNSELKIIGLACLSHFIVKSIKLGGYFDYGTIFFLSIILIVIQISSQERKIAC